VKHVFGPVPSRRLGFSLGVDLIIPKTCTMDCVYCELGPTTDRTVCRRAYVDVQEVLDELREVLSEKPRVDYVTLSGSGEPTLHTEVGRVIDEIRALTDAPVAVLTNGSLMTDPEVRAALARADVVAPSLDAVSDAAFRAVNRPDPTLDAGEIAAGIARFKGAFGGELWLETVFVRGINDTDSEITLIRDAIGRIAPDRVHINTVTRPPAEPTAQPVSPERLRAIAERIRPDAEVVAHSDVDSQIPIPDAADLIVSMATRRPVTARDVARAVGMSQAEAAKVLGALVDSGVIRLVRHAGKLYYRA